MRFAWGKWPWCILPVENMRACPDCHAVIRDTANFCGNCGFPFGSGQAEPTAVSIPTEQTFVGEAKPGTCSSCGYQNVSGEMFCKNCGVQLAPVASAPPPQPSSVSQMRWTSEPARLSWQCPNCGYPTDPEDDFCENCGAQISPAAVGQSEAQPEAIGPGSLIVPPKIAIHLVVRSNNALILLDMQGAEWLVGRADPVRGIFPEVDLTAHGGEESGVSRRHARL